MKASIKIATAADEFTPDQINIMKRICMVLIEHNLSVDLRLRRKISTTERLGDSLVVVKKSAG